ncbi:MAG: ABC transporter ATP-binding protein [Bacilli bacterium]|nr:ABC transporter ATP-binding protein [Bacilli bacterium]
MKNIIEVKKINKSFGNKQILHDVSFNIGEGEILGFIGPNGAGKTTTIKLILGLQSIDSGEVIINGYNVKTDFEKAIEKVGAIVESPDLYMYLSGKQNLKLIANMYKDITNEDIDKVIKQVGLENRINDKVSKYSLGMRQRLGIAASLIHKPNVLILDEPTNGLDPEGIKEMRELLIKLAKEEKMAILISSHNLAELDNLVTNTCIIKNGEILSSSSVKELKKMSRTTFKLEVDKTDGVDKIFKDKVKIIDNDSLELMVEKDEITECIEKLIKKDYKVYQVVMEELSLEDAFMIKTGGNVIE